MDPAMRELSRTLARAEHVVIKPFQGHRRRRWLRDSGSERTPESQQSKKRHKKIPLFGKKFSGSVVLLFGNMKERRLSRISIRTEHHTFFLVREKEIRQHPRGQGLIAALSSATAAAPSKRACGTIGREVKDIGRDGFVQGKRSASRFTATSAAGLPSKLTDRKAEEEIWKTFSPHKEDRRQALRPSCSNMRIDTRIPGSRSCDWNHFGILAR